MASTISLKRRPRWAEICTYAPFESDTMGAYQDLLDTRAPNSATKADVPNVQQALTALQEKALVWRASRGVYALEDATLRDLLAQAGLLPGAISATGGTDPLS